MQRFSRSSILHLAVFGFYLLVVLVVTYPLVTQFSSVLVGFVHGDSYEMAHHVWWFKTALQSGQSPFYQSLLAYPNGFPGVTLWSYPLQFFPSWLFAFVLPLPAAVNLAIVLTLALNGWAMFFLARQMIDEAWHAIPLRNDMPQRAQHAVPLRSAAAGVGGAGNDMSERAHGGAPRRNDVSERAHGDVPRRNDVSERAQRAVPLQTVRAFAPALLAGLVFMLYPTMQGHLGVGHAGVLVQWAVPLYVYALLRLREGGSWRGIVVAAIFFFLSATGHPLEVIYVLLPLTGVYVLMLIFRREWVALRRTVIAVVIGGVLLGVLLIPVLRETLSTSAYADEGGSVRYSADLLAVFTPSFRHPVFDHFDFPSRVLGTNLDEGAAYIGVIAGLLALVAVWKVRGLQASLARWWLAVALVAWILSLGPLLKLFDQPVTFQVDGYTSYVTLPFALIANLPLIRLARTPGRFDFALALAVAALAGYGAAYLWARIRAARLIKAAGLVVVMALIAFEYQVFFPLPLTPAAIPQAVADLAARDDVRAVFDIPWDNLIAAKEALYLQTAHQHPLIAGQETRRTPVNPAKLTLLESTLDPALLRSVGADVVLVHRDQDFGALEQLAREQLGDPVFEDAEVALFNTPPTDAAPEFSALPFTDVTDEPLSDRADSYVYAPQPGWVTVSAQLAARLAADEGRSVALLLDGDGRPALEGLRRHAADPCADPGERLPDDHAGARSSVPTAF